MRLSILSNVNLDMLSGLLKKENEVFQTDGYGEWITYALKKDERLAAFAPECLFFLCRRMMPENIGLLHRRSHRWSRILIR